MDNEENEFEIPYPTDKTQKELEDIWLKNLETDFDTKVMKYKPLAKKNDWILPTDPIGLFYQYFYELEKEKIEEYKDDPTRIKKTLNSMNDEEIFQEFSKVSLEIYPNFYELIDRSTIRFPKPIIPESFIEKWIKSKKDELTKNGLFSRELNPPSIVEKKEEIVKGESSAVRYLMLFEMFEEKKIFQQLSQNQREKILGYILGVGVRTAKAIKNNEPKYINEKHKERSRELLEKIKKEAVS